MTTQYKKYLGVQCLGLFLVMALFCTSGFASTRPNILLIMADDLGYECIGANGGTSYKTPVLDGLADAGVRFEHCYAQPLCTPSRVKIMTGIYNVRNYVKFGVLDRKQTTFAHLFKKAGYATCIAGKWQLGKEVDAPQHFGFDEACLWQHFRGNKNKAGLDTRYESPHLEINGKAMDFQQGEFGPDVVSDYLCSFMERHKDTPFLAYYPMILTHCPFVPTPDSEDWNPRSQGSSTYKGNVAYFGDMVAQMDKTVGKLIRKLEALGLRENTLVLFVGDNGTDTPVVSMMGDKAVAGAKGQTTDGGTRVPCIASWPGVIAGGKTCQDLVDFTDVLPTLCDATNISLPQALAIDGRSFLPQMKGQRGTPRDWIYCWYSRSGASNKAKEFARNQRYKLYRSGKFFDIQNDVLEKHSLGLNSLSKEVEAIHGMLSKALARFEDARPAAL